MRDNIWDLSTTKKTTKLNILYGLVGGRIRWLGRQMYAVGAKQYTFSKPRNQVDTTAPYATGNEDTKQL